MKYLSCNMTFCLNLINLNINKKIIKGNYKKYVALCYVRSELNNLGSKRYLSNTNNSRPIINRENFIPFDTMVEKRRSEARRSIVVEIHKKSSVYQLQSICSKFGNIKNMAEFEPDSNKQMVIVEFEEETSLNEIVQRAQLATNGCDIGSIQIPFLKLKNNELCSESINSNCTVPIISSQKSSSSDSLFNFMLNNCENLSEQIQHYYESKSMTELGWRIRFLTCRKMEWVLPAVLSYVRIIPFGSSVNTFGNNNCDLDMLIDTSNSHDTEAHFPFLIQSSKQSKGSGDAENNLAVKNLKIFADILSFYMPGIKNIHRILHARVPIIKCNDLFTGLECDITFSNKSGYFMSELLYLYGCSDPRVRPLIFCIRLWAKERRLTRKDSPGRWFSNFTITMMALFYLMNASSGAVITSLEDLENFSENHLICEGIRYSYVRDVAKVPVTSNTQTLEELLLDFFSFYATFNYKEALSIITGKTFPKPINSPLFIQNPMERTLNISRNVNSEELETFKKECILAFRKCTELESKSNSIWGLPMILSDKYLVSNLPASEKKNLQLNMKILMNDSEVEDYRMTEVTQKRRRDQNLNVNISNSPKTTSTTGQLSKAGNKKKKKSRNSLHNYKF